MAGFKGFNDDHPQKFAMRILTRKMRPVGEFIRTAAALNAPYLSGDLRRSLNARLKKKKTSLTTRVGTNLIYAGVVELGFTDPYPRAADPYLLPALMDNKPAIMHIFKAF